MNKATFSVSATTPNAPGSAVLGAGNSGATFGPDPTLPGGGGMVFANPPIPPVAGNQFGDLSEFDAITIWASLVGATSGTLDVYVQASPDVGTTWYDVVHFTQLAGGASAVIYVAQLSRHVIASAPTTTGDAVLAAGAQIQGDFGDRLRIKVVAGTGTTAGAALSFKLSAGSPCTG